MSSCLSVDAQAGELESQCLWYEARWGVKYRFPDAEFRRRCTYCHGREHAPPECDRPVMILPSDYDSDAIFSFLSSPFTRPHLLTHHRLLLPTPFSPFHLLVP
jgi:hypothetical protein